MTNDDLHRGFLDFGQRQGLMQGERLAVDVGMWDEQHIVLLLKLAYAAGMQAGVESIRDALNARRPLQ